MYFYCSSELAPGLPGLISLSAPHYVHSDSQRSTAALKGASQCNTVLCAGERLTWVTQAWHRMSCSPPWRAWKVALNSLWLVPSQRTTALVSMLSQQLQGTPNSNPVSRQRNVLMKLLEPLLQQTSWSLWPAAKIIMITCRNTLIFFLFCEELNEKIDTT